MKETRIEIDGMHCEGCVNNISGLLRALPGVHAVRVSLSAAEAVVEYDAAVVERTALCAVIADAGFEAR